MLSSLERTKWAAVSGGSLQDVLAVSFYTIYPQIQTQYSQISFSVYTSIRRRLSKTNSSFTSPAVVL